MVHRRSGTGKLLAALAAVGLLLSPALAAGPAKKRPPAVAVSFDPVASFTPANADPKLAASFAGGLPTLGDFKFTPAAAKGRPSQIRVAIRAGSTAGQDLRLASAPASTVSVSAITPASYNLGVAVGWRRFAVSGDVSKVRSGTPALGERDSAEVGVSYSVDRFTARVAAAAAREDDRGIPALRDHDNYSLDVGGAYNLTRNIAVTGGVRYRIDKERLAALKDERRDSQAVYVGTAFKF